MDKVTPTSGIVELKCGNCKSIVQIDLSYRVTRASSLLRLRLVSGLWYKALATDVPSNGSVVWIRPNESPNGRTSGSWSMSMIPDARPFCFPSNRISSLSCNRAKDISHTTQAEMSSARSRWKYPRPCALIFRPQVEIPINGLSFAPLSGRKDSPWKIAGSVISPSIRDLRFCSRQTKPFKGDHTNEFF